MKLELKVAENLAKALKDIPVVKIGILSKGNARNNSKTNNASIGKIHEFGTSKLPQRSFLRMPLNDHLFNALKSNGAFDEKTMKEVIKEKSGERWAYLMAATGLQVIAEAFDTGGFGQWKASNMKRKKNHQTLVETQQLRDSISYEVKK